MTTGAIADGEQQKATKAKPVADETCSLIKWRYRGRCGRCGHEIWSGEMVRWAPGRQPVHATPEACGKAAEDEAAEDPSARFWDFSVEDAINRLDDAEENGKRLGVPRTELTKARRAAVVVKRDERKEARAALTTSERWDRLERLGAILLARDWQFARTMATNPHWYSRRREWPNQEEFVFCVETLRLLGYAQKFGSMWYTAIDLNDHFYWTMGWPILPQPARRSTMLINRKPGTGDPAKLAGPYDATSDTHPVRDEPSAAKVFEMLGDLTDHEVLDVGCGSGRVLDSVKNVSRYVGIDPSHARLTALRQRHPHAQLVWTTLASFVPVWPTGVTKGGPQDALLQRPAMGEGGGRKIRRGVGVVRRGRILERLGTRADSAVAPARWACLGDVQ
ncbi:MAG TPA: class I SAM-dependent methyltransferase [Gemmatimonadaceae bacterium]|nr:class I SAM-dependent methyltransferase [Gemmatimonadaceae bacterium]